jgi:hypothetical protein
VHGRTVSFDERALTASVRIIRNDIVSAGQCRLCRATWIVCVAIASQLVVQVDDAFERPGGGFLRGGDRDASTRLQLREHRLNVGAQLLKMRGVCLQLLERLLMHRSQRMSFASECFFESADAVIEVTARRRVIVRLPLMKSEAESIQLRLEAR